MSDQGKREEGEKEKKSSLFERPHCPRGLPGHIGVIYWHPTWPRTWRDAMRINSGSFSGGSHMANPDETPIFSAPSLGIIRADLFIVQILHPRVPILQSLVCNYIYIVHHSTYAFR